MRRISNWTKAGMSAGVLFILFTAQRYFIQYHDTSFAIICILIGILIMAVSFLYQRNLDRIEENKELKLMEENNKTDLNYLIHELKEKNIIT